MDQFLSIEDVLVAGIELAVRWSDEKESYISFKQLRDNCPCAFCSGEKDVLGNVYKGPKKELGGIAYEAVNFEKIGHYAVRIFWGDRHSDGLFTYDLLRKLGDS